MLMAKPKETDAARKRYLALGDSYTIGDSVTAAESYPVQLVQALRAQGVAIDDATIIARGGWRTDDLEHGIRQTPPTGKFDLVTLLIGVNNQYQGRSATGYRPEFVALLQRAVNFAGEHPEHVIVISIPDYEVTPRGRERVGAGQEIDEFNRINREEATRMGAHYVDITPSTREALHDPSLIAVDGLHLSGKLYARWIEMILPIAFKVLSPTM
jgi:lysophospholipase L1-like esterase